MVVVGARATLSGFVGGRDDVRDDSDCRCDGELRKKQPTAGAQANGKLQCEQVETSWSQRGRNRWSDKIR